MYILKLQYLFVLLVVLVGFISCKENSEVKNYYHRVAPVKSLVATLEGSYKEFYPLENTIKNNEIRIEFPYFFPEDSTDEIDVSSVKLYIEFDEEVTVLSEIPEFVNLEKPYRFDIRNADGRNEVVSIIADVKKSNKAQILSFALPSVNLSGTIVNSINRIGIERGQLILNNITPKITISGGATISPDPNQAQNFNNDVQYTVTAQDGTKRIYSVVDLSIINNFEIKRGINVASWLSVSKYDGEARASFFNENDIIMLSQLGFDHVRLNLDEVQLWDQFGGKIRAYGFDLLHNVINWCIKHKMRVIVDLHITRNHRMSNNENLLFTDPNEPAKFVKLWEDFSDELKDYPNSLVAYELLNEPVSANASNWNRILTLGINAIRAREPNRTIIVGVCTANGSLRHDELILPSTHQILLTDHFYGPYLLTAYGLPSTTGGRRDIPIQYPGQLVPNEWISQLPSAWQSTGQRYYDKSVLETSLLKSINMSKKFGLPIFIGELGTLNTISDPTRSNWYRDVISILEKYNVAYSSFDYKGAGYSVFNEDRTIRFPSIVDILIGK